MLESRDRPPRGRGAEGEGKAGCILATIPSVVPVVIGGESAFDTYAESLNAARWLEILTSDGVAWHSIIATAIPDEDVILLSNMLISGKISQEEVSSAAKMLLTRISGRNWWEVFGILALAEEAWEHIGGDMAMRGVDPSRVTLGTWLDAAWTLIRRLALQKGQRELDQLVGDVKREPLESGNDSEGGEMDASEFLAAAGELAGILPGLR